MEKKLWNTQKNRPLTPLTVVIGKNGSGKSTLFDVFGFLADCLKLGVEEACDARGRGGFDRIRSQECSDPIEFQIYYRQSASSRPITYEFAIDTDKTGRPYVKEERLRQRREGQRRGWPFSFLWLNEGRGMAWKGDELSETNDEDSPFDKLEKLFFGKQAEESSAVERVELQDKRRLGIATLGALKQHPRISAFRQFIEGWHLSYFTPDAIKTAYPKDTKEQILNDYVPDSICGTWETLADAIYPGGSQRLKNMGYPHIGRQKSEWAGNIARHLDPKNNRSKSFQVFRDGLRNLAKTRA